MRKLIQLSPSTSVVSLPSRWVRKHGLVKGDELEVQELEDQLIISTHQKRKREPVTIDLRALPRSLVWARCDAAYIVGHDRITFLFLPGQEDIFESVKNEVPGMMITQRTKSSITFQDITAGKAEDIQSIITRILHMISDLQSQALELARKKAWKELAAVKKVDYVINSYISYAQRQINKFGFEKTYTSNLIVTFLKLCETFADRVCELCERKVNADELEKVLVTWRQTALLFLSYSEEKLIACERSRQRITHPELKTLFFDILEVVVQIKADESHSR